MTTSVSFQNGSYLNGTSSLGTYTTQGKVSVASIYNTDALDNKYTYSDTKESYEIAYSGRDAAISADIKNITNYLDQGQEDKAMAAYQNLLDEMSEQTRYAQLVSDDGDDTQLRAVARELIEEELGSDLNDYIVENASNSFERGLEINWNGDNYQEEDLLKEMCNVDTTNRLSGVKKVLGATIKEVGGVAAGVLTGVGIAAVVAGAPAIAAGAAIGGVVAGVATLATNLL
jgi:hypothetical protein